MKLLSQEAKEGKGRVSEHIKHNEMLENSEENLIKPQVATCYREAIGWRS